MLNVQMRFIFLIQQNKKIIKKKKIIKRKKVKAFKIIFVLLLLK